MPQEPTFLSPFVAPARMLWADTPAPALAAGIQFLWCVQFAQDPRGVLEGLGPTIAESAILYDTSDLRKLLDPNRPAAVPKDGASVETINFADKFGRVHLARLCSAVCHSERTAAALAGDALEFFRMLALLATRQATCQPRTWTADHKRCIRLSAGPGSCRGASLLGGLLLQRCGRLFSMSLLCL